MIDSLALRLRLWADAKGSAVVHTFVDGDGAPVDELTYADLLERSTGLAARLTCPAVGVAPGDRAVLCFPPGLDFIVAFYACGEASVAAVPVFPPDPTRSYRRDVSAFASIVESCGSQICLTNRSYSFSKKAGDLLHRAPWPAQLRWIVTDDVISRKRPPFLVERQGLAFLQYTSGSTSEPKGVMISHGNLSHNLFEITSALKAGEDTVCVSWLPQYHDMGLIGSYLGTAYCGGRGFHSSPLAFIRDPVRWVRDVSNFKATHVQAPSFAYGLVARKFLVSPPEKRPSLDLSHLRHAINAAEPVRCADVDAFLATFGAFGLKAGVLRPTYGLAEHTVFVCTNGSLRRDFDRDALHSGGFAKKAVPGKATTELFGCGAPPESVELAIVSVAEGAAKRLSTPGAVGEIWLRSKSRALGYWNDPEKSKADFGAALDDDANACGDAAVSSRGWLRTGDVGFFDTELYICGRVKDLLIVRGRNHYPQDLEATAEAASNGSLRPGCSAAVALMNLKDAERIQLVCEWAGGTAVLKSIVDKVRRAVASVHGVELAAVTVLQPRSVPKTTSGKISRSRCAQGLLDGSLKGKVVYAFMDEGVTLSETTEATGAMACIKEMTFEEREVKAAFLKALSDEDVVEALKVTVSKMLKMDPASISSDVPISSLGLGSMEGMQLLAMVEDDFGCAPDAELMYEAGFSLSTLCKLLRTGGKVGDRASLFDGAKLARLRAGASVVATTPARLAQVRLGKADLISGFLKDVSASAPPPRSLGEAPGPYLVAMAAVLFAVSAASFVMAFLVLLVFAFAIPKRLAKRYTAVVAEVARRSGLRLVVVESDAGGDAAPLLVVLERSECLADFAAVDMLDDLVPRWACPFGPTLLGGDVRFVDEAMASISPGGAGSYTAEEVARLLFSDKSVVVALSQKQLDAQLPKLCAIAASAGARVAPAIGGQTLHALGAPLPPSRNAAQLEKALTLARAALRNLVPT
ncbi:hypothetical protein M885DRAFT_566371 [Pelagophyceae sp. CCMP2097]|nr:hypothetical protein M885DRAFT_566371 [Pelagophyceae sp. CCMP2097]